MTVVPPLPDEADPITSGVSPVMWQTCNSVGLAVGLIVLAGTLAGVPPDIGVPLNEAIATASGPNRRVNASKPVTMRSSAASHETARPSTTGSSSRSGE